jgi:hypothetical protein
VGVLADVAILNGTPLWRANWTRFQSSSATIRYAVLTTSLLLTDVREHFMARCSDLSRLEIHVNGGVNAPLL